MLIDQNDLLVGGGDGFRFRLSVSNLETGGLRQIIQAGLVLVVSGYFFRPPPAKYSKPEFTSSRPIS